MTPSPRRWPAVVAALAVGGAVGAGVLLWPSGDDGPTEPLPPAPAAHEGTPPPASWAPPPPRAALPERLAELAAEDTDAACAAPPASDADPAAGAEESAAANDGCVPLSIPERLAALPEERPAEEIAERALRYATAEHQLAERHPDLVRCLTGARNTPQVTLRVRVDVPLNPGEPGRAVLEALEPAVRGAEPCVQEVLDTLHMPGGRSEDLRRPVHREAFYRFAHPLLLPDPPG